jgi:hypothetical protein
MENKETTEDKTPENEGDSKQPQPPEKSYFKKYGKPIIVSVTIIIAVVILVVPIIPVPYTITQTGTRYLRYSSEEWGYTLMGISTPTSVNVTNKDIVGGTFSVTMKYWENSLSGQSTLLGSSTQSAFISAGSTYGFPLPSSWEPVLTYMNAFSVTYSVSAPTTQYNYNVSKTEYRSILNLL